MRRSWQAILIAVALGACRGGTADVDVVAAGGRPGRFGLGSAASPAVVSTMAIAVDPEGAALPEGQGSATQGAALYRARCAQCHGTRGEGMLPAYPRLVGRDPREGFPFGRDPKLERTIGNYWPYATTLFDYVRRAMPLPTPGTLTNDEVYSLTAYLLAANEIVPRDAVLDAESLRRVRMPARERFVRDDRRGGADVR